MSTQFAKRSSIHGSAAQLRRELWESINCSDDMLETWLNCHRPAGNEPIHVVLDQFLNTYEKTYGDRPNGSINYHEFGKWRRGIKPIPRKILDLMRAELLDFAFGLELGPDFVKQCCKYLGLPVLGDL